MKSWKKGRDEWPLDLQKQGDFGCCGQVGEWEVERAWVSIKVRGIKWGKQRCGESCVHILSLLLWRWLEGVRLPHSEATLLMKFHICLFYVLQYSTDVFRQYCPAFEMHSGWRHLSVWKVLVSEEGRKWERSLGLWE